MSAEYRHESDEARRILAEIERLYRQLGEDFKTRATKKTPQYLERQEEIRLLTVRFEALTKE